MSAVSADHRPEKGRGRCDALVRDIGDVLLRQCKRRAVISGFCKQHDRMRADRVVPSIWDNED
jgi:hypothetical protein